MFPNFLVIGAYKSGTTSLFRYLAQHPQVFLPRVKEPSYFAFAEGEGQNTPVFQKSIKTLGEYESLFVKSAGYSAVGDVSPEYMTSPSAATTIKKYLPDVKLIAILRNPIERAYSDYLMYVRDGLEIQHDFSVALKEQADRAAKGEPTGYYISTGFYGEQLARYYDIFPSRQIMVIFLEDMQADGPGTLSRIFSFLGVDPTFIPNDLTSYNRSGVSSNPLISRLLHCRKTFAPLARRVLPGLIRRLISRKLEGQLEKPAIEPQVRQMLRDTYTTDIRLLEQLTGMSCRHWLE